MLSSRCYRSERHALIGRHYFRICTLGTKLDSSQCFAKEHAACFYLALYWKVIALIKKRFNEMWFIWIDVYLYLALYLHNCLFCCTSERLVLTINWHLLKGILCMLLSSHTHIDCGVLGACFLLVCLIACLFLSFVGSSVLFFFWGGVRGGGVLGLISVRQSMEQMRHLTNGRWHFGWLVCFLMQHVDRCFHCPIHHLMFFCGCWKGLLMFLLLLSFCMFPQITLFFWWWCVWLWV